MSNNAAFLSQWIQLLGILGRLKGWGCFLEVGNSISTHLSWEASSKQGFSRASWAELEKQIGLRRKGIYPEAVKCSEQTFSRSGSQFKSLQGSSPRDRWVKMEIQHETLTLTQSCGKVQNCRSSKEEPNGWVSQKTTWHKKIHPRLKHLSGVTGILEEGLTNHNSPLLYKPSKSPSGHIWLVEKQRTGLIQTWPAFSGVIARKWRGQDQQVPTSSPSVDNHIQGHKG